MTDAWIRGVVEAIHSAPNQAVLYLAGGASQVCPFPCLSSLTHHHFIIKKSQ